MERVPPGDDNEIKQSAQPLKQMQFYQQIFLRFQLEVKSAGDSLAKETHSTPAQCSRFVGPLFQYDKHITAFYDILQKLYLPDHTNKKRYEALIEFQKIAPSLDKVKECRDAFASSSLNSQREWAGTQRYEILKATQMLEKCLSGFNKLFGDILNALRDNDENVKEPGKQGAKSGSANCAKPSTPPPSSQFDFLYELLANYTKVLDLKEICRKLKVNYNRLSGNSHAERAFSLSEQLENENRLSELEVELRRRLPERFRQSPPSR